MQLRQASRWNIANFVTFLRFLIIPFVVIFYVLSRSSFVVSDAFGWLASGIFLIAAFSDQVDGYLARRYHLITDLGAFLDPLADKALVITTAVVVSYFGALPWFFTIIIAAREGLITCLRIYFLRKVGVISAGYLGKIKTVVQMIVVFCALIPCGTGDPLKHTFILGLSILGSLITVISGGEYIRQWVSKTQAVQ